VIGHSANTVRNVGVHRGHSLNAGVIRPVPRCLVGRTALPPGRCLAHRRSGQRPGTTGPLVRCTANGVVDI